MGMVLHGDPSLEFFLLRLSLRLRLDFLVTAEAEAEDVLELIEVTLAALAPISEAGLSPELSLTCLLTVWVTVAVVTVMLSRDLRTAAPLGVIWSL